MSREPNKSKQNLSDNGTRMNFGAPIGMVISSRIILHRADRLTVVLRTGKNGSLGLVGGKIHVFERSHLAGAREVREETGLELSGSLRHEGTLKMPNRTIWYPVWKFRELGFAFPETCEENSLIQLWNPRAEVYSGLALGALPNQPVEDREVVEIKLTDDNVLKRIKARHRPILRAWRDFVVEGLPFPNQFIWEE
jgi:8-oxo-dGTP pyrophosphatase MutT (NUDIX family)